MAKNGWVAFLVHSFEKMADLSYARSKFIEELVHDMNVVMVDCFYRLQHSRYNSAPGCFNRGGNDEKPLFIFCPSKRIDDV
jgi:hypothetical protein